MCHFSGFTRVINTTQVILEAARIPYIHPLFFLVSPFCTCKFLLAALKMLLLRRQSSLPRLVVCLLDLVAPWEGWEPLEGHGSLLQAHSKLKHLMVGPTLWTVLRSEVSLGHLGEVVGAVERMLALGTDNLSSDPDFSLMSAVWPCVSYFSSLSANYLIPKMEIMILTLQGFCEDVKHLILYLTHCMHLICENYVDSVIMV